MLEKKYSDEEDFPQSIRVECGAAELQEMIGNMEDNAPDKRTKGYRIWRRNINKLISEYNCNFSPIYKLVK